MAPDGELIVVKLGNPGGIGFPRTAELMQAVDYIVKKAEELRMPVSINISFGNTYGSHNGTSLPERFLDRGGERRVGTLISVGTGNEGAEAGHASGFLREGEERNIPLAVQERQGAFSLQIWTDYTDVIGVALQTPSGGESRSHPGSDGDAAVPGSGKQSFFFTMGSQVHTVDSMRFTWSFCRRMIMSTVGSGILF